MLTTKLARMLGWTGIGIGLAEIFAPKQVEKMLGVQKQGPLLQTMGAREIAAGMGIVSQKSPSKTLKAGVWSRVAGDALDLALLGAAAKKTQNSKGLRTAVAMVAGVTALDVVCAMMLHKST